LQGSLESLSPPCYNVDILKIFVLITQLRPIVESIWVRISEVDPTDLAIDIFKINFLSEQILSDLKAVEFKADISSITIFFLF